MRMKLLVIGASNGIGLETVRQALAADHDVRAFSRSASRMKLEHSSLEKLDGNALSSSDVSQALDGVDAVVQVLGVSHRDLFRPVDLFSRATEVLLECMAEKSVKRLVCVTGFGAGDSREAIGCLQKLPFEAFLGRAYADKDVQERLIKTSEFDWTIVRPTVLTNASRIEGYKVLTEPQQWRNGFISRRAVADFIVRELDDNTHLQKAPVITF
jgi:putative NADH-flavin reductase